MDVAAIQGAMGSLKLAFDITKKFLEMKSIAEVQGLVIDLRREIISAQESALAAQSDHAAMAEKIRTLKEEIVRMETWAEQKQKYALVQIAAGAIAFALKEECKGAEPPHWICANCYEDGRKSILNQRLPRNCPINYYCPRCKNEVQTTLYHTISPQYA